MKKCVALNCNNIETENFKFFNFPNELSKLTIWKKAMKRPNWCISKNSQICEVTL